MNQTSLAFVPIAIFVTALGMAQHVGSAEVDPAKEQGRDQTVKNGNADEKPDPERERQYKNHKYRHDDDAAKPPKFSYPSAPDRPTQPISGRS